MAKIKLEFFSSVSDLEDYGKNVPEKVIVSRRDCDIIAQQIEPRHWILVWDERWKAVDRAV